jgi:hypothetical protein
LTPDLITALTGLASAVGAVAIAYLSYKARKDAAAARKAAVQSQDALVVIEGQIFALGMNVDGRLTQLLATAKAQGVAETALARAEGVTAGEKAQRDRE